MQTNIRQQLSDALARISDTYAQMLNDRMTRIEREPTPFFQRRSIYRIEHMNPRKPFVFYAGFAPGEEAYLLTDQPENFVRLAQADGISIQTPEAALDYAKTYLRVTRSMSRLIYIVETVADVRFRPNLMGDASNVKNAFVQKYWTIITPPSAQREGGGYVVSAFVVQEQALEKYVLSVEESGGIRASITTLERNLPLVYGL